MNSGLGALWVPIILNAQSISKHLLVQEELVCSDG